MTKIKPHFRILMPPSSVRNINKCKYSNRLSEEEKEKMTNRFVSEEKLADRSVYPCPFCGERNYRAFYVKKSFSIKDGIDEEQFDRGLMMDEVETSIPVSIFPKSKEHYFYKEVHCTTCGAIFRSNLYRKNRYVKIPSI